MSGADPSLSAGDQALVDAAGRVRLNSASPYSHFKVGAALLSRSGAVYLGTNVESSSLGLTICAEQAALCAAVAGGEAGDIEVVAVIADCVVPTPPCGACRQLLHDYAPRARVILANTVGHVRQTTVSQLLPEAFDASMLPEP